MGERRTLEVDQGAARITIERLLRDDDDASGQTIREWKIEAERAHLTVRLRNGDGFLMMRLTDVDTFVSDLYRARDGGLSLFVPVTEEELRQAREMFPDEPVPGEPEMQAEPGENIEAFAAEMIARAVAEQRRVVGRHNDFILTAEKDSTISDVLGPWSEVQRSKL